MAIGHPASAERERHGDDRGQPFRDGGDREADRDEEHVLGRLAPGHPGDEDDRAHHEGRGGQATAEHGQAMLQGGVLDGVHTEQLADLAELGGHPGRHDDAARPAEGRGGALERHVVAVGHPRALRSGERVGGLHRGLRLACERRLVDVQAADVDQSEVSGDHVAGGEVHEITRHEVPRRHVERLAVAHDLGGAGRHLLERGHGLLGAVLLHEADDGVEHDDHGDDDRVLHVADDDRDDAGQGEHHDHRVGELAGEDPPRAWLGLLDERVRPAGREATRGLDVAQSVLGVRAERGRDGQGVAHPRRWGGLGQAHGRALMARTAWGQ